MVSTDMYSWRKARWSRNSGDRCHYYFCMIDYGPKDVGRAGAAQAEICRIL